MGITVDERPILRMTRTIGSWMVQLEAVSVRQFTTECGGLESPSASSAIERLVSGATVRETDEETCYAYFTADPAAVRRQWSDLCRTR